MPLTVRVNFVTVLEKGNRLQVPKLIRWQFKMEHPQVLSVRVSLKRLLGVNDCFYAKMDKQGRILVPKLTLALVAMRKIQTWKVAYLVYGLNLHKT
jgi:DNA-binding transcriptional regulator/RsmH inhibitor MraZ